VLRDTKKLSARPKLPVARFPQSDETKTDKGCKP